MTFNFVIDDEMFKNGNLSEFLSNQRAIEVTNSDEWQKFKPIAKLCNSNLYIESYEKMNKLNEINNRPKDVFYFEFDNKGLTWDSDFKRCFEWFGKEPLRFN